MNTITAIWHSAGKGKSSTILELANLLLKTYPNYKLIYSSKDVKKITIDFRLVIEINGKIITLESQGDPGTKLKERLEGIIKDYSPNIIFCTCRTRGETVNAIENTANKYEYDTIWTSTYQTTHNHKLANQAKAEDLLDLVSKFGLI